MAKLKKLKPNTAPRAEPSIQVILPQGTARIEACLELAKAVRTIAEALKMPPAHVEVSHCTVSNSQNGISISNSER